MLHLFGVVASVSALEGQSGVGLPQSCCCFEPNSGHLGVGGEEAVLVWVFGFFSKNQLSCFDES